jgi:hypothetical protein
MLQLTKAQYKQLCADCAAQMMQGSGHGGQIEDFSGTDMQFRVKDAALTGGGFTDTLSSTWKKVKDFVQTSPLAQKVVNQGLAQGKRLAKEVAGKAVQAGLEKLGIPESAMDSATALAGEAFDRMGDAAERKAQSAIIGKAPTVMPAVANTPGATEAGTTRRRKNRKLQGSGFDNGEIELGHGAYVSTVPFDSSILPAGATIVSRTNALQMAY